MYSSTKKKPTKKKSTKQLTKSQEERLKKHSVHHSKKHIDSMKKDIMNGMSFKDAHNKAMEKVGK